MKKTGKILLAILALLIIIGMIWGIREVYLYNNPDIVITYKLREGDDYYLLLPTYAIGSRSKFGQYGYAERYNDEMKAWWLATNEMEEWLVTNFVKPMHVVARIEIVDGKTVITYSGTATSLDGEVTEIYREIVLDFVVSKNLPLIDKEKE